jgi:hypothetical protein
MRTITTKRWVSLRATHPAPEAKPAIARQGYRGGRVVGFAFGSEAVNQSGAESRVSLLAGYLPPGIDKGGEADVSGA